MNKDNPTKLTRRQFALTLGPVLAAPALLGGSPLAAAAPPLLQEKPEEKKPEAAAAEPEDSRARALKALREFELPAETEPAFVFHAGHAFRR